MHDIVGPHAVRRAASRRSTLRLDRWSIPARSAAVSAAVVLVALLVATGVLLAVLHGMLLSSVDDAAHARVDEIVAALADREPAEIDEALIATDELIAAVQINEADGQVLRHSAGSALAPLLPSTMFGVQSSSGIPLDNMRLSGETFTTPTGAYTVIVGGATQAANQTVRMIVFLLMALAPLVVTEAAFVNYRLVKRSLRSVDAIRAQVAAISSTDLSERVPVPPSRDEIASLAITMNAMLERIERGQRAQHQFVGDASHELRNPLATILSTLEMVETHPHLLNADLVSATLLPEVQRMRKLIDDLLLLARADEKGLVFGDERIALDDLVGTEVARRAGDTALEYGLDLEPVQLHGDGAALSRMISNLLDNAAHHASAHIDISVRAAAAHAVLRVADDGRGVPESQRQRIFDRFVRLDADRSRHSGGAGLGLSIVAEIVRAHNGTVVVGDRVGGGAAITVTLPSRQQSVTHAADCLNGVGTER